MGNDLNSGKHSVADKCKCWSTLFSDL